MSSKYKLNNIQKRATRRKNNMERVKRIKRVDIATKFSDPNSCIHKNIVADCIKYHLRHTDMISILKNSNLLLAWIVRNYSDDIRRKLLSYSNNNIESKIQQYCPARLEEAILDRQRKDDEKQDKKQKLPLMAQQYMLRHISIPCTLIVHSYDNNINMTRDIGHLLFTKVNKTFAWVKVTGDMTIIKKYINCTQPFKLFYKNGANTPLYYRIPKHVKITTFIGFKYHAASTYGWIEFNLRCKPKILETAPDIPQPNYKTNYKYCYGIGTHINQTILDTFDMLMELIPINSLVSKILTFCPLLNIYNRTI